MEEVAPLIAAPFFFHWYVIGAVPVAATLNVAVCPAVIFALAGCEEIVGATGSGASNWCRCRSGLPNSSNRWTA